MKIVQFETICKTSVKFEAYSALHFKIVLIVMIAYTDICTLGSEMFAQDGLFME